MERPGSIPQGEDNMIRRILCYGDSNTWGYDPVTKDRFDETTRWPRVLGQALGQGWEVIEEGLGGRTTVWDDPIEGYKNGRDYLIPCLESHRPLDAVVLLLGINDLKQRFSLSAYDVAQGVGVLVRVVQASQAGRLGRPPQVLLLAPPPLAPPVAYGEMFAGAAEKSRKFSAHFALLAQELGCAFLDTGQVVVSSPLDGIHFEREEHRKLGGAVAESIGNLVA
ncbi:MAG: SGNH/GDSL hydrolase family protein [Desulfobulbus sp.]|uniref:SGNH/GDSL hydrolase family protein n=1 Tax=Desulfobulbus sp. TaxID=895 RepID=UPI00283D0D34|nr:SGNH/GDSL hydrolase family protein [Desulfobulbus sp.]MDR2549694.1 SGNH/GDSL hydrolase family protein [Desulfobulbus sp.]